MAKVYYDDRYRTPPLRSLIRDLPRFGLPPEIRTDLQNQARQRLIPFLGAGASASAGRSSPRPSPAAPPPELLDRLCSDLQLDGAASRTFLDVSLRLAQLLDTEPAPLPNSPGAAPSSAELAQQLAAFLSLEPLRPIATTLAHLLQEPDRVHDYTHLVRRVSDLLGISRTIPPLLTVASYFCGRVDRAILLEALKAAFGTVTSVTNIQRRVGLAAQGFVNARNALQASSGETTPDDYLIVTTNYDCLMESHLDDIGVPTCVITVDRNSNVSVRFMPKVNQLLGEEAFMELQRSYGAGDQSARLRKAAKFELANKRQSLAMVYKMHGSPTDAQAGRHSDNVVIADHDYVAFIQNNARYDLIPAYVRSKAAECGFLFLGYSFNDWNVRALYEQFLRDRRTVTPDDDGSDNDPEFPNDYVVIRDFGEAEAYFLQRWRDLNVVVTELDIFAANVA